MSFISRLGNSLNNKSLSIYKSGKAFIKRKFLLPDLHHYITTTTAATTHYCVRFIECYIVVK